jgi:hypothetical protein
MVVVITIIAILAGALLPVLSRPFVTERRLETINEMGQIEQGIIGRWEYGDYGYIGTIGNVPASVGSNSFVLWLLNNQSSVPTASAAGGSPAGAPPGVPVGWNGPYIRSEFQDPTRDAWGQQYKINLNPADPTNTQWNLQSAGPDQQYGTTDDIYIPAVLNTSIGNSDTYYFDSAGQIVVDIWEDYGPLQTSTFSTSTATSDVSSVTVWYPQNGVLTSLACTQLLNNTVPTSQWTCGSVPPNTTPAPIPFGLHSVIVAFQAAECNPGGKFYSYYNATNATCQFQQNVVHERPDSYAKVVIPVTPTVTAAGSVSLATGDYAATGVTNAAWVETDLTGDVNHNGNPPGGPQPGAPPPAPEAVVAQVTATGSIEVPSAGVSCYAALEVKTSTNGGTTWTAPVTINDSTNHPIEVTIDGNATTVNQAVPFSITGTVVLPANTWPIFMVAFESSSASAQTCTLEKYSNLTITEYMASP